MRKCIRINGVTVELKGPARHLDPKRLGIALKNAGNRAYMVNRYHHPRSDRLRVIMASKTK